MDSICVYFATNRNPISDASGRVISFGDLFSAVDLADLRFGKAEVVNGKLDTASLHVLPDTPEQGSMAQLQELREQMKDHSSDSLLFLHGFNTSFSQALEAGAAIVERYGSLSDHAYQPNIFVFTWPSDGKLTRYHSDRNDARASAFAFARGLHKLTDFLRRSHPADSCQQRINLMAHSMGNYVLRHAFQESRKMATGPELPRLFDEIILTAADEDYDAFEHAHKLADLPDLSKRVTVYFNDADRALNVSDLTKGNPERLGSQGPRLPHQLPSKVVVIDASDVVKGVSEHSYHLETDNVVRDMIAVLQGQASERIDNRRFVPHANKFRLRS